MGSSANVAPQVTVSDRLTDQDAAAVEALAVAARAADGVAPLSENTLMLLRSARPGVRHLRTWAAPPSDPTGQPALAGYATVESLATTAPGETPGGEIVVHPSARRRGHGGALLTAMLAQAGDVRVWAHGDLPAARALAAARGMQPVRELWQMSRPLDDDLPDPALPDGFALRAYRPGADDADWLRVNAAAFAHHPEQGSWTQRDLDLRLAAPWFDAAGFLVLQDATRTPPAMAGYHWTKVHPATEAGGPVGEVYVVGVDPEHQGRGLSVPLVAAGLTHLRRRGLTRVILYVDADNAPAVRVYTRLGFSTSAVDVMFTLRPPEQ